MKKTILCVVALATVLCIGLLAGCSTSSQQSSQAASAGSASGASAEAASSASADKVKIVCATFPAYDWVRQIAGDKADACEITYLMGNGVDLHSYQPSVEDIAKISDAQLFVYVGGESDMWAVDAVNAAANPDLHTVSMLEAIGDAAVEEELVEGMEGEKEEGEAEGEEEGPEYDEHVWLSLKNAQVIVDAIAGELAAIDPDNAATYTANADAYKADLAELDGRYADAVKAADKKVVVFADRFPFRYLVDDYDLDYYAAFVGCSAETEASFETVAFLANKVDELGISNVLVIEDSDENIAKTVVESTKTKDQGILVMDSLQSTLDEDVAAGKTYKGVMEENLSVLTEALA